MSGPPRILIVEDEPLSAAALRAPLVRKGYQVDTANNGDEALDLLRTTTPDLIILDVMMPGMNGFEVCRRVRQDPRNSGVRVVFMTAKAGAEDIVRGRKAGSDMYLVKPVLPARLLGLVEMLLSREPPASPPRNRHR